ncbi:MAG: hypothetical protein D4R79_15300 [Comamonadaceae bacterium]|nr:MAG: hypothetical protein D4R79_15300 [Comamonadaceae bacterium]
MNKAEKIIQLATLGIVIVMAIFLWTAFGQHDLSFSLLGQKTDAAVVKGNNTQQRLSPAIDAEIKDIEAQLKSPDRWPKDIDALRILSDRFASAVDQLPPQAVLEKWPDLLPRRWDIDALWLIKDVVASDVDGPSDFVGSATSHLEGKPERSSKEISEQLRVRRDEMLKIERTAAIAEAKKAINGKNVKGMEKVAEHLSKYMGQKDKEVEDLVEDLGRTILRSSINESLDALQKEFDGYAKMPDPMLKEFALTQFAQGIMSLRLRLHSAGLANDNDIKSKLNRLDEKMDPAIKDARKATQARDADRVKKYQVMALTRIKGVRPLKDIEDVEIAKVASVFDRNNPMSAASKAAKARSQDTLVADLVRLMAPINQGLLDEAVSQWFRKTYSKRFEELDEARQLELVTRFATANKLPLE